MTRVIVDDTQELMDGMNAINGAIADHDAEIIDNQIRVKEVERIQSQIQDNGASRPLMEELQQVSGQDDILLQRGVAVESFTSFPSRTNVQVSLEVSDDVKAGLIGAAIAAGAFIVYKIIKMIVNFFKRRSSASAAIKQSKERLSQTQTILKEWNTLRTTDLTPEEKKVIDEIDEKLNKALEKVHGKWTLLLDNVFGTSGELKTKFENYIHSAEGINRRCIEINSRVGELMGQLNMQSDANALKDYVERRIDKELLDKPEYQPNTVLKQLDEVTAFGDLVKQYAGQEAQADKMTIDKAAQVAKNAGEAYEKMEQAAKFENSPFADEKAVDKLADDLKAVAEKLKENGSGLKSEQAKSIQEKVNALTDIHKKSFRISFTLSASIALLASQLNEYLTQVLTINDITRGFFQKLFDKGTTVSSKFEMIKKALDKDKELKINGEQDK